MKKKCLIIPVTFIIGIIMILSLFSCINDDDIDIAVGALRAVPVAASSNFAIPKIIDSFRKDDKNWYIIDAGYIRDSYIMQIGPTEYQGFGSITLTRTETVESSVTRSSTETVLNSIVVSEGSSITVGLETAIKTKVSTGIFSVKTNLETSLSSRLETTRDINITTERSKETSTAFIQTLSEATSNSTSITLNRRDPKGQYRYAWYTILDVYFLISTDSDNQELLSWDVISCVREGTNGRFEYSLDGKFDNSPTDNLIKFADDFYKKLPIPTDIIYQQYSIDETFNYSVQQQILELPKVNFSNYNPGFTIEVYALGAGGGGQGGYSRRYDAGINQMRSYSGTGGAGGGGAAAYMKFTTKESETFVIEVGRGGIGGSSIHIGQTNTWRYDGKGSNGGNTIVKWGNNILTVNGGEGGGRLWSSSNNQDHTGGLGGNESARPSIITTDNWRSVGGNSGDNGGGLLITNANNFVTSRGGIAGILNIGSINPFGGGVGGYNHVNSLSPTIESNSYGNVSYTWSNPELGGGGNGSYCSYNHLTNVNAHKGIDGGNGQVKIIVTWYE